MKKFLIIGNMNAITYKEIFPLIKENKLWLGVSITSGDRRFDVPNTYALNAATCGVDENGVHFIRVKGVRWFTNIEHSKRNTPLDLYKRYNAEEYPKYDNYCAFNINRVADIPMDEYIDVEIPDDEYPLWKKVYGDDVEIIERSDEDKNT